MIRRMTVLDESPVMAMLHRGATAAIIACFIAAFVGPPMIAFAIAPLFVLWAASTHARRRKARSDTSEIKFDETGVEVTGEPLVPIDRIVHGRFVPSPAGNRVRLVGSSNETVFEAFVADEREANLVLRALGRDPLRARARFLTAPPRILPPPFNSLLPDGEVEIGVDGVSIRWWKKKTRFIPFKDIAGVKILGVDVVLILANASYVPLGFASKLPTEDADDRAAFVARLESAMAGHAGDRHAQTMLARGSRSVADWGRALASVREGGYRAAGLRDEDLVAILNDPKSPGDVRFAAGWMLARDEEEGRPRVRVALEAIAEPNVRIALERTTTAETFEEAWGDGVVESTEGRARESS